MIYDPQVMYLYLFQFDNRSINSDIKAYYTKLELLNTQIWYAVHLYTCKCGVYSPLYLLLNYICTRFVYCHSNRSGYSIWEFIKKKELKFEVKIKTYSAV